MFGQAQPSFGFGAQPSYFGAIAAYMPNPSSLAIILLVAIIAYFTSSTFFYGRYTVPLPSYKSGFVGSMSEGSQLSTKEGFMIPKRSFLPPPPDCTTDQANTILNVFGGRKSTTEEGERDFVEFKHLLNKLSCFKKDLVSPNYTVSATLKQPFITTHDVEAISETTGRCFAKTIPPRDLDIAMDKWSDRGGFLIRRLCTSFSLKDAEATQMETSFQTFLRDVYDTARDKCLQKEPLDVSKRGPRDPSPFSVRTDPQVGEFNGYY
jgi:hypothetical protein